MVCELYLSNFLKKDKERPRNYTKEKETKKDTWQVNAVSDPQLDPVLEGNNAMKTAVGLIDKTGIQMVDWTEILNPG